MITLNDYLYNGDTIFRILQKYSTDLRSTAKKSGNEIDILHANFLMQMTELLAHNEFLTAQSNKIREFYMYMVREYPFLAFTFKGRIKSLIRAEEKFNGNIVEYIYDYYQKNQTYPATSEIKDHLSRFRDLIAYRIIISAPDCHLEKQESKWDKELQYLYEIANVLPGFLEERGFTAEISAGEYESDSVLLQESVRPYYKDYIRKPNEYGYQSLHITLFDNSARCYTEVQLRTKEMDDCAEIGPANHLGYEKRQEINRLRRDAIPVGECVYFDDAYVRGEMLQSLELNAVNVNMFAAADNSLINDGCGLYRGRLILPFEHLSRFQNDSVL
ncbi:MAG: guanosine polyphosphate pyrophosphohydrolase [Lachnospiraceae bacterium]|nr:guanosine polyphosphate pyrophosphohydrolase [Lachnospiraceae bacterium]